MWDIIITKIVMDYEQSSGNDNRHIFDLKQKGANEISAY